jgi:hypothetical protein
MNAPLFPQAEFLDDRQVSFFFRPPEIVEQPSPLTDQFQQPSSGMVVLLVGFEMLGQGVDAIAQNSHLDFRRTRVIFMQPKMIDNLFLSFRFEHHVAYLL